MVLRDEWTSGVFSPLFTAARQRLAVTHGDNTLQRIRAECKHSPPAPFAAPRALIGQEQNPIMAATETDGRRKGARSCNKVFRRSLGEFSVSQRLNQTFRCVCLASHCGASQNEPVSRRPL